ncbi:hypothetical protein [Methanomassiliicoccus luminyensis]|uniref:hypothetical protein n=1 Tax=Methanomassiliicoccus luminyensis TaxID=1080712 RepID=UPI0011CCC2DC|nr:hypothetical protein [Methanomassiliicoccus luminyensis]
MEAERGEIDMGLQDDLKARAQKEKDKLSGDAGQKAQDEMNRDSGNVGGDVRENVENAGQKIKEKIRR